MNRNVFVYKLDTVWIIVPEIGLKSIGALKKRTLASKITEKVTNRVKAPNLANISLREYKTNSEGMPRDPGTRGTTALKVTGNPRSRTDYSMSNWEGFDGPCQCERQKIITKKISHLSLQATSSHIISLYFSTKWSFASLGAPWSNSLTTVKRPRM